MGKRTSHLNQSANHLALTWPSWSEMVLACRDMARFIPEIVLPEHRLSMIQVRPYLMPRGWRVRPHEHSFYEISLILKGYAKDNASSGQMLGPGHVFFHTPQTPHSWGSPTRECIRLIIWFTVDPPVTARIPNQWPCWPWLLQDIAHLFRCSIERKPGWPDQAASRLAAIIAQTLTLAELPKANQPDGAQTDPMVIAVNSFLEDNYSRAISLDDVASCAGVSLSGLVHRYRKITGTTVLQRLMTVRMDQAAYLLKETELPLKAICTKTGIDQPAYFCRLFQRYFRTTPGKFRKITGR